MEVTLENDDESIECTFLNEPDASDEVATVTASAAPSSVVCSGSSFVIIVVKTASGQNVADGTAVSISTNIGQLSPTSAMTSGGGVLTIFTASSNQGGTATITASAAGKMGTALITVDCATQPTPAPTATPLPPIIQPPSTGDAGLVAQGTDWRAFGGLLLIATSLWGSIVLAGRRV